MKKRSVPNLTDAMILKIRRATSRFDNDELKKEMIKLGFMPVREAKVGRSNFFINKKKNILVKEGFVTGPKPKCAVPSIYISRPNTSTGGTWAFIVQPLCDTSETAKERAWRELVNRYNYRTDFHSGNIGMYKGRAVMFDW